MAGAAHVIDGRARRAFRRRSARMRTFRETRSILAERARRIANGSARRSYSRSSSANRRDRLRRCAHCLSRVDRTRCEPPPVAIGQSRARLALVRLDARAGRHQRIRVALPVELVVAGVANSSTADCGAVVGAARGPSVSRSAARRHRNFSSRNVDERFLIGIRRRTNAARRFTFNDALRAA